MSYLLGPIVWYRYSSWFGGDALWLTGTLSVVLIRLTVYQNYHHPSLLPTNALVPGLLLTLQARALDLGGLQAFCLRRPLSQPL